MSISHPFNGTAFPWRKKKLEQLISADDAKGLDVFLKQHPRAVEWEVVHGPNHHLFIHEAVEDGKYNATRVLLEHGARTDTYSDYGHTLMEHALRVVWGSSSTATPDNLRMAQLLLDNGADINGRDKHERTNLACACWMGNVTAAQFLIDRGADPTLKRSGGMTLLMDTLLRNDPTADIAKVVLSTKPDLCERNDNGRTVFFYARDPALSQMLLEAAGTATEAASAAAVAERQKALQTVQERDREIAEACHRGVPVSKSKPLTFKRQPQ